MDIFEQDYKEFCELFADLSFEQAKEKADELGLDYNYDEACELIDVDYKHVCATVCSHSGKNWVSTSYDCFDDNDIYVKSVG